MICLTVLPLILYSIALFKKANLKWIPFIASLSFFFLGLEGVALVREPSLLVLILLPVLLDCFWKIYLNRLNGFNPLEMTAMLAAFGLHYSGFIGVMDVILMFWFLKTLFGESKKTLRKNLLLFIPFLYFTSKVLAEIYGVQVSGLQEIQYHTANITLYNYHIVIFLGLVTILWKLSKDFLDSFLNLDEFKNLWGVIIGGVLVRGLVDHYPVFNGPFETLIIILIGSSLVHYLITNKRPLLVILTFSLLSNISFLIFLLILPFFGPTLSSRIKQAFKDLPEPRQLLATLLMIAGPLVITSKSPGDNVAFGLVLLFLIVLITRIDKRREGNL